MQDLDLPVNCLLVVLMTSENGTDCLSIRNFGVSDGAVGGTELFYYVLLTRLSVVLTCLLILTVAFRPFPEFDELVLSMFRHPRCYLVPRLNLFLVSTMLSSVCMCMSRLLPAAWMLMMWLVLSSNLLVGVPS